MFIEIDTKMLDDNECKQCGSLLVYCRHDSESQIPDIQKIYDTTGINLYDIANNRIITQESIELIAKNGIQLVDLQEFRDRTEITSCTLAFMWKDLLNKIDPSGAYKFMCEHRYPSCEGEPGYFCFYNY